MTSSPPTQAVILAGGQGTRLRPITDTMPKPMIPFHGRPFLEYLLDQLKAQGIQEVLLLVGYRASQVQDYFGDGAPWGLHVSYVESPVEAETGQRLADAGPQLEPSFLLMYCDNYWPMQMKQMWETFQQADSPAMVTVYSNRDGYSRSNVCVDDYGHVTAYDPARTTPHLNGVELGYALMTREVLDYLPSANVSFEHTVYPVLSERHLLSAFWTEHRYYSVGSHERLHLTEAFLEPQRAVILDRDGVLNTKPPRAQYVLDWSEFQWIPGAVEALQLLKGAGYKLIVATNQPGVARGFLPQEALDDIHAHMRADLEQAGAPVDAIYCCCHGWDDGCFCRKPNPGLLFEAQRAFHLDLTHTLYIGDDERDLQAGQAAGCPTILVSSELPLVEAVQSYVSAGRLGATT